MTLAMFATLIFAITLGHPLAYTLAAVATLFGLIDNGFNIPMLFEMFANNIWGLMNNYTLVAVPLFILMAQLLDRSKVADALFESLYIVLGGIKGGLGLAVVVVCTVFAATTGIIGASVVAMGLLATPALMLERSGIIGALRRGWVLTSGTFWRVFGIYVLTSLLVGVVSGAISGSTSLILQFAGPDPATAIFSPVYLIGTTIAQIVAAALTTPFTAAVIALLYIDVRMRTEGLDLELARAAQESL